jgi:phospholipid/cholesterol/gamma-HCH transport system substrate-binding protein
MNNTQQTARVGLFFVLGLALIWVAFATLSGGHLFKAKGYTVLADFDNLKDLKVGDEVRMAGVLIGSVEKTQLVGRGAEAVLLLDPGVSVPDDSIATIEMSGIIGTDHVSVDIGKDEGTPLADGARIKTKVTPDLNSVMAELGELGQKLEGALGTLETSLSGDGSPGGGLFQKLDKLVTDNSGRFDTTMSNLQQISTKLNNGEGTLGKLINDPKLHDDLLATVDQLKAASAQASTLVANAGGIVDHVKSGQGALGMLVYDQKTADNLQASVQNLRNVSDKLASGQGTLGKLINDDTLFYSAQTTMKKADRAIDSLNDSGPITAVGIVAQSLF